MNDETGSNCCKNPFFPSIFTNVKDNKANVFITSKNGTKNKAFIYLNTAINTTHRLALHTKNNYVS